MLKIHEGVWNYVNNILMVNKQDQIIFKCLNFLGC